MLYFVIQFFLSVFCFSNTVFHLYSFVCIICLVFYLFNWLTAFKALIRGNVKAITIYIRKRWLYHNVEERKRKNYVSLKGQCMKFVAS
jgi:hypothetical protein